MINKLSKNFIIYVCLFLWLSYAAADPLSDIVNSLSKIEGYQNTIQADENDIKSINSNIQNYTQQMQQDMSGNYGWGTNGFQDFQSWGNDATDWNSVLSSAQNGGGSGNLGQIIQAIQNSNSRLSFNTNAINSFDPNQTNQNYYAMQAQTILAARAASQLDFNHIQNQINYENNLREDINGTSNVKSAVDLQNRLASENNLIQLEILRQIAILNQQKSVSAQQDIDNTTENTSFLAG